MCCWDSAERSRWSSSCTWAASMTNSLLRRLALAAGGIPGGGDRVGVLGAAVRQDVPLRRQFAARRACLHRPRRVRDRAGLRVAAVSGASPLAIGGGLSADIFDVRRLALARRRPLWPGLNGGGHTEILCPPTGSRNKIEVYTPVRDRMSHCGQRIFGYCQFQGQNTFYRRLFLSKTRVPPLRRLFHSVALDACSRKLPASGATLFWELPAAPRGRSPDRRSMLTPPEP